MINYIKSLILGFIILIVILLSSCQTIYNYDLSLYGLDSLPATKSCILKYIPKSIDVNEGQQVQAVNQIILELNAYEDEIRDSLFSDSIIIDTSYTINFTILVQDPNYDTKEIDASKIYYKKEE